MKTSRSLLLAVIMLPNMHGPPGLECHSRHSVAVEFERAIAVFSGKAIAEEYRKAKTHVAGQVVETEVLVVKFKVERWWKGNGSGEVVMFTSETKIQDGIRWVTEEDFKFRKGESYLVYAHCSLGDLRTNECKRTRRLAEAEEDLRELGQGSEPTNKENRHYGCGEA